MLVNSPGKVFLPLLLLYHPHHVLHPSANTPGLSLCTTCGLAQGPITDQDEVPRAHQAQVPYLAVAVGPVAGPQHGPKPLDARDLSTHEQHQIKVLKSSLQMRPLEVRRMSDVLDSANEADVSQGSMSLLDISTADDEDTLKRKAWELACKIDTNFTAWRDKLICDGVVGIQEQNKTVNDYADPGKKRPKNPDTIGPPISYMKERGVFQPLSSMMNPLGLCWFYPADPSSLSTSHGYCVAHSVPIPSKMIQHTSTTSLMPITTRTSHVGHV